MPSAKELADSPYLAQSNPLADLSGQLRILRSIGDLSSVSGPVVIAAGVFDGMHLGHQTVLRSALDAARDVNGTAVALTFDPHPARILRPKQAPRLLTSTAHKLRLIEDVGFKYILVVPFDHAFAEVEPEDFVRSLVGAARPLVRICVGQGWLFGRGRRGSGDMLRSLGTTYGFETTEVSSVRVKETVVSSTLIRAAVEAGDLATARRLLGRDYAILGTVEHGEELGRRLGFPTANLAAHNEQFPPDGVYAVKVGLSGKTVAGVANIGSRPTVSASGQRMLEVHLLNFSGDLYGQDIEAAFVRFLRPEIKFPDLDSLKSGIAQDVDLARRVLGEEEA